MSRAQSLADAIESARTPIEEAIPSHMNSDKFLRLAKGLIFKGGYTTDKLLEADHRSVARALIVAAGDGLYIDGREATILPYGDEAAYTPMVYGLMKKVRNSGELKTIGANVVYEKDEYTHWTDEEGEHFKHTPARGERGDVVYTYAYARTNDGGLYFEEITEEEMEEIKKMSRGKNSPWRGPFADEMRKKSALRRLMKRLPMSSDVDMVITRDDDLYILPGEDGEPQTEAEREADEFGSRLREAMGIGVDPGPEVEPDPQPHPEDEPDMLVAIGTITDLKVASGETDGKPWTRVGILVADDWYGTFHTGETLKAIEDAYDNGATVEIRYEIDGERRDIAQLQVVEQVADHV